LEKILNDDYVKFIAKSQDFLTATGAGLVGLITNHAYLDNPTMRGLRHSFIASFKQGYFYDLGGSAKKVGENVDENVFDIQQGVAICVTLKNGRDQELVNRHARLIGARETKYKVLGDSSVKDVVWSNLSPSPPYYLFVPTDYGLRSEYEQFIPLSDVFPLHSIGCFTSKDHFVISRDPEQLVANAKAFRDSNLSDKELCKSFEINPKNAWDVSRSREQIGRLSDKDIAKRVLRFTHRPFDLKHIFFHRSLVWSLAYPVNRNLMKSGNLALVTSRQLATPPWNHVFCANGIVEMFLMSNKTKEGNHVFPLHVLPEEDAEQRSLGDEESRPNFFPAFLKRQASALNLQQAKPHGLPAGVTPEDIFHYAYAVFHSRDYRSRYAEFLKIDFPRLPLTGNQELFRALAWLGGKLVALHLLESSTLDKPITHFLGGRNPEVEKVSWSKNTVWIDKAQTTGFKGVREDIWEFHIGCYQVCEKWLKDRKGRTLSKDDINHYQKIVVALSETMRLMSEIDKVIEEHGGWPAAFQTSTAPQADAS
jgi:predicted helicase